MSEQSTATSGAREPNTSGKPICSCAQRGLLDSTLEGCRVRSFVFAVSVLFRTVLRFHIATCTGLWRMPRTSKVSRYTPRFVNKGQTLSIDRFA